jgi:Exonuclease.
MKKIDPRLVLAVAAAGLVMALWLVLMSVIVWSTLDAQERLAVGEVLASRTVLVAMGWLLGLFLVAGTLHVLHRRYVGDPHRLLEKIRVVVTATTPQQLTPRGTAEMQAMARAVNELAAQRDQLRGDMAAQVAQASHSVQQEKNRLAALMAELNQSVVVCNRDGRILLYNQRARQQFRQLRRGRGWRRGRADRHWPVDLCRVRPAVAGPCARTHSPGHGAGCGQPVGAVCHHHAGWAVAARAGGAGACGGGRGGRRRTLESVVSGFVLMLDNVTASVEEESARDQLLHGLTEGSRASLANIQAAVDMLGFSDLEPAMRERFLGVVRDEVGAMGRRITDLAQRATQRLKTRWPMEDMLGADLATAAQRRIAAQCDRPVTLDAIDGSLWLKVDSYTLLQALTYLAHRLVDEFEVRFLQLRLQSTGTHAQLDLVWSGQAMSNETVMNWEMDAMRFGAERSPLTVREVVERHGGEMWFERERVRHQAFFRFMLPLASVQGVVDAALGESEYSRPEYYDFDLFKQADQSSALDDRPLSELAYTVFDTETTGLNPAGGDAIIQIGAARIVNGKLLRQECLNSWWTRGAASRRRPSPSTASPTTWWRASRASARCCRCSMRSRKTRCWWRTTRRSTCAFCSCRRRPRGWSFTSLCSTRCCSRPWCTRTRSRTGSKRLRSVST